MNLARAIIVGRLTHDPELNESGRVLRLSVAVNRRVNHGGEWQDETSFFDVKVLGDRASKLYHRLAKGRQVTVDAKVVQERWEDRESGQKRSKVVFLADTVEVDRDPQPDQERTEQIDLGRETSDIPSAFPPPPELPPDEQIPF